MLKISLLFQLLMKLAWLASADLKQNFQIDYFTKETTDFRSAFLNLINAIDGDKKIQDILLLKSESSDCVLDEMLKELSFPFMVQTIKYVSQAEPTDSNRGYTQETLIFICFLQNWQLDAEVFKSKTLQLLHNNRFVIYHRQPDTNASELTNFCEHTFKEDVYNVLVLTAGFAEQGNYYGCLKYPPNKESYAMKNLHTWTTHIFPPQFLNMHGGDITTQPLQLVPYSFRGVDKSTGKTVLLGYMAKVITTYVERRNATLRFLLEGSSLVQVAEAVRFGYIDLGIIPYYQPFIPLSQTSNPYTVDKICFLIPEQGYVPIKTIFYVIIRCQPLLLIAFLIVVYDFLLKYSIKPLWQRFDWFNYWFNDKCLRSMLGQSFPYPSKPSLSACFVCLQVFIFGLWINTAYQAFLQSWLTQTPFMPRPQTLDTLEALNLRVITVYWPYNEYLLAPIKRTNPQLVQYVDSGEELIQFYYNFDTRYTYPIAHTHWLALQEQQQYFQKQLFFYLESLCASQIELLKFPVRPRLPHRDLFNFFILQVHESGLYRLWLKWNFYDMVRVNLAHFKDFSSPTQFGGPLLFDDLSFIFWGYFSLVVASLGIFAAEILTFRYKSKQASL